MLAAQRGCQAARAKGHVRLEVLKKEIDGELVLRVAEFAIPSGGELVIGVDAGMLVVNGRWTRGGSAGRVRQRKQIPIGRGAKLIALKTPPATRQLDRRW